MSLAAKVNSVVVTISVTVLAARSVLVAKLVPAIAVMADALVALAKPMYSTLVSSPVRAVPATTVAFRISPGLGNLNTLERIALAWVLVMVYGPNFRVCI
jgi:hypothetical protein